MFLITTADQRTWERDRKILFLGEWCKTLENRGDWENLDFAVVPYHWDDRDTLYRDFKYLTGVYEAYLATLSSALNEYHGCDRSLRYWRIIVGPWLRYFVDMLYDRYCSVRAAPDCGAEETCFLTIPRYAWTPRTFNEFYTAAFEDGWNHYIYSELISRLTEVRISRDSQRCVPLRKPSTDSHKWRARAVIKSLAWNFTRYVAHRYNDVTFVSSCFRRSDLIKLQLRLGEFPSTHIPAISVNSTLGRYARDGLTPQHAGNEFESLLEALLAENIPAAYVEEFAAFRTAVLDRYPRRTKVIFTANAFITDDAFKLWSAEQVESGATLLVAQHSGLHGASRWDQVEDHQIAISDRFYTWGWSNRTEKNIVPKPANKLVSVNKNIRCTTRGSVLWVQISFPRYAHRMSSWPMSSQALDYLDEQLRFATLLKDQVTARLVIRTYPHDHGWGVNKAFENAGLQEYLRPPVESFETVLSRSRICVSTYNATTFLETFSADFPTLLFWNPHHWELRPQAARYYDALREAEVLHDTPESAARKLNDVFDDPRAWWSTATVQEAVQQFRTEYCYVGDDWLQEWREELQSWLVAHTKSAGRLSTASK